MTEPPQLASLFDDGKAPEALRTIGEVGSALGIKQHVLRYWEQQFPMLSPLKRSGGRRYYRPGDVELVATIDRLVNRDGYTLKGARQALTRGGKLKAEASSPPSEIQAAMSATSGSATSGENGDFLPQLRAIRHRLAQALEA